MDKITPDLNFEEKKGNPLSVCQSYVLSFSIPDRDHLRPDPVDDHHQYPQLLPAVAALCLRSIVAEMQMSRSMAMTLHLDSGLLSFSPWVDRDLMGCVLGPRGRGSVREVLMEHPPDPAGRAVDAAGIRRRARKPSSISRITQSTRQIMADVAKKGHPTERTEGRHSGHRRAARIPSDAGVVLFSLIYRMRVTGAEDQARSVAFARGRRLSAMRTVLLGSIMRRCKV